MKRFIKVILYISLFVFTTSAVFILYANSLTNVNQKTVSYYHSLKKELKKAGYQPNLLVISGKRAQWHNKILTYFGAASKSQHLKGNAIDIVVLDVNEDGNYNFKDVDITKAILEKIIQEKGGIGTYKTERFLWNRQMIHFDCRGHKARWYR